MSGGEFLEQAQKRIDHCSHDSTAAAAHREAPKKLGAAAILTPHDQGLVYGRFQTDLNGRILLYGESTSILSENRSFVQRSFNAPRLSALNFALVGTGEKGGSMIHDRYFKCGQVYGAFVCDAPGCGKVHYAVNRCKRRSCPNCYELWIHDEVERAAARLLSEESLTRHVGKRLAHIIVSPDQDHKPYSRAALRLIMREGYEYMKKKRILGGFVLFHAFRASPQAKEEARKAHSKTWAWIRSQDRPQDWYYYSPHFHVVGFIDHLEPPEEGEKWIYKSITTDKGRIVDFMRKSKRDKELRGLLGYLLSHAVLLEGMEESFHAVRWFGSCSYNKFVSTPEEAAAAVPPPASPRYCKVCGGRLIGLYRWMQRNYQDYLNGSMEEPRYFDEICYWYFGTGSPPPGEDAALFLAEI